MPEFFEIFGYPLSDQSEEARSNRLNARCPFMGRDCDGGGNRYLSHLKLTPDHSLKPLFPNRENLAAGVCSIQVSSSATPWIVCPRRLLVLGRERAGERIHQKSSEVKTLSVLGYASGTKLGIWPEVKIKYLDKVDGEEISIDYSFDYVLMPLASVSQSEVEILTGIPWVKARRNFEIGGYSIAKREDQYFIEDCPVGPPSIIEIMTSSTSGGNQKHRSTIPMAFEDVMLGKHHLAPGINYRQVWARMASQLIAKSEIALGWGGKTIWVVQDVLVNYISKTTALNIRQFLADHTNEVNLLSFSYGEQYKKEAGVIELPKSDLFSGPISSTPPGEIKHRPSFQDIVRSPVSPPITRLREILSKRGPVNQVIAP